MLSKEVCSIIMKQTVEFNAFCRLDGPPPPPVHTSLTTKCTANDFCLLSDSLYYLSSLKFNI